MKVHRIIVLLVFSTINVLYHSWAIIYKCITLLRIGQFINTCILTIIHWHNCSLTIGVVIGKWILHLLAIWSSILISKSICLVLIVSKIQVWIWILNILNETIILTWLSLNRSIISLLARSLLSRSIRLDYCLGGLKKLVRIQCKPRTLSFKNIVVRREVKRPEVIILEFGWIITLHSSCINLVSINSRVIIGRLLVEWSLVLGRHQAQEYYVSLEFHHYLKSNIKFLMLQKRR